MFPTGAGETLGHTSGAHFKAFKAGVDDATASLYQTAMRRPVKFKCLNHVSSKVRLQMTHFKVKMGSLMAAWVMFGGNVCLTE